MNAFSILEPPSITTIGAAHRRLLRDHPHGEAVVDVEAMEAYADVLGWSADFLPPQHSLAHELWSVASQILTLAPAFDITHNPQLNRSLGIYVLEEWLTDLRLNWFFTATGQEIRELEFVLGYVPAAPKDVPEVVKDWIKDWLLTAI